MKILKETGKILLLSIILAGGLVLSRILLLKLGILIPRLPEQADENTAVYYLLAGSLLLSAGWFYLIKGIGGSRTERLIFSSIFILTAFSFGVTNESAIYSNVESYHLTMFLLILPMILYAIVAAILTDSKKPQLSFFARLLLYFKERSKKDWLRRILFAILSFPLIYFVFGIIASPFVTHYYSNLVGGLDLPDPGTIIAVQLIRSMLFLAITIPVVINWTSTKTRLIISLCMAHFVMVFAYDIYLAIVMPVEMVIIHGIEIMADSFVYSFILVNLLWKKTI